MLSRTLKLIVMTAMVVAGALPASAGAVDTDCPGGSSPCPYQGVSVLDPHPATSPDSPVDAVVSPVTHDIYVSDRFAYRVKQYGADGTFIRSWGGRGSDVESFDQSAAITIDADGNVWLTELNNNRIVEYTGDGKLLAVYPFSQGSADGQLLFPQGLAIAPDNHIWIADTGNNRVVELAADGTFVRKFGKAGSGPFGAPSGTGLGEFSSPSGITVAANGDVWVADRFNNRVQRLPSGSTTWEATGVAGSGPGEFFGPQDVDEGAGGAIYVTDSQRTQRFAGGVWTDLSPNRHGNGIGVGDGKVVLAETDARRVRVLDETTGTTVALAHPIEPLERELKGPQGLATDSTGHLFVADTDANRVVKLDATTGNYLGAFGQLGSGNGDLNSPWGIATDGSHVFVADTNNHRIVEFDGNGAFVATYGTQGIGPGQFSQPFGLAIAPDGGIVVADTANDRVMRSSADRTTWTRIGGRADGTSGTAAGEFDGPGDVAITAAGDIFVADTFNNRVQKLPSGGSTWSVIGSSGSGDGQFSTPRALDTTADGAHLYVADTNNARVQQLSGAGTFEAKWGRSPFGDPPCPGEFNQPFGLAVDPGGNVLTDDNVRGHVLRFRFTGGSALAVCDRTPPTVALGRTGQRRDHGGVTHLHGHRRHRGGRRGRAPCPGLQHRRRAHAGAGAHVDHAHGQHVDRELVRPAARRWVLPLRRRADRRRRQPGRHGQALHHRRERPGRSRARRHPARQRRAGRRRRPRREPGHRRRRADARRHRRERVRRRPDRHGAPAPLHGHRVRLRPRHHHHARRRRVVERHAQPAAAAARRTRSRSARSPTRGSRDQRGYWMQITSLAVAQLNDGVPVDGTPPGANPVIADNDADLRRILARRGRRRLLDDHGPPRPLQRLHLRRRRADVHDRSQRQRPVDGDGEPAAPDETWRVRVTQPTSGGTRQSAGWYFQLKSDLPLAVTQLDDGVPVSGSPPGANPVLFKTGPVVKGTASIAAGASSDVQVHYDRNSASGFVSDAVVVTVARNATTGVWQASPTLTPETWRVRVTQDGQTSSAWYFQIKADPPVAVTQLDDGVPVSGSAPGANPLIISSGPNVGGTASIAPGSPATVLVHYERYNGSTYVPFTEISAPRDATTGAWSLAPALGPESYQVWVSQGSASSAKWRFQLKRDPALAVTQLDTNVPVSGNPPGANPVFAKGNPAIRGTASIKPGAPTDLKVHFDRNSPTGFKDDAVVANVTRDADGNWAVSNVSLTDETYRVHVTQGSASSASWFFQLKRGPTLRNAPGSPTGLARVGRTVYAYAGDWTQTGPITYTYDWFRCPNGDLNRCTDTGKRGTSYDVTADDSGARLVFFVHATDSTGTSGSVPRSAPTELVPPPPANVGVKVQGIEITQGSQVNGLPVPQAPLGRENGIPFEHPVAAYSGVTLVERSNTAVRVFASASRDVRVLLYGFSSSGAQLSGGPLSPINTGPADLGADSADVKRLKEDAGFTFSLPLGWASGTGKRLVATVIPAENGGNPTACDGCNENNAFALKGISFTKTQPIAIRTVKLKSDKGKLPNTKTAYADYRVAQNFVPGANNEVTLTDPWVAEIDVSKLTEGKKVAADQHQKLLDWAADNPSEVYDITMGTSGQDPVGMTTGRGDLFRPAADRPVASVATDSRANTDVAHELFHALGRKHASTGCGGAVNGQQAEKWTDERGELLGVGLDFLTLSDNTYRLLGNTGGEWLDFMSYCSNEANSWLSPRNWNAVVATIRTSGSRRLAGTRASTHPLAASSRMSAADRAKTRAAGTPGSLRVSGYLDGGPLTLSEVSSGAENPAPPGDPSSVSAIVRDASGAVVGSTPLSYEETHVSKQLGVATFLAGNVPGGMSGKTLQIVFDGQVLATRTRSANPPAVKLLSPKAGKRVRGALAVRWTATDADNDKLVAKVDYSIDDGRSWETVSAGADESAVTVPGSLLAGSRTAKVRVVVNDGWNETTVVSPRFIAAGSPPHATIDEPANGTRTTNAGQLVLSGQATDDRRRALTGRRLTWFAGRKRLGSGESLTVSDLKPGRQTLRLVARDAQGRKGTARRRITVKAVAPTFLRLEAPKKVAAKARTVKLRVAAAPTARLTSGKTRAKVGRKAKTVRIRIKKGQKTLGVQLVAHGKRTRAVIKLRG